MKPASRAFRFQVPPSPVEEPPEAGPGPPALGGAPAQGSRRARSTRAIQAVPSEATKFAS